MNTRLLRNALCLCFAATSLPAPLMAQARQETWQEDQARRERYESERAKGVASVEVGGEAIAARRIDLNGATGGWEVVVRMSHGDKGWRVIVDRDTWTVRSKQEIANP